MPGVAIHAAPRGKRALRTGAKLLAFLGLFTLCATATGWTIELGQENPLALWVMVPITVLVFVVTAGYSEWLITGTDPTDPEG